MTKPRRDAADVAEIFCDDDRDDAGQRERGLRADLAEACVRVRRSQHRAVQHPGQPEVGGVFSAAREEPPIFAASHAAADCGRHAIAVRDCAAARAAFTMFA